MDFETADNKSLLQDERVKRLMAAACENPMWTIHELVDSLVNTNGSNIFSYKEVAAILSHLELRTQSQRLAYYSKFTLNEKPQIKINDSIQPDKNLINGQSVKEKSVETEDLNRQETINNQQTEFKQKVSAETVSDQLTQKADFYNGSEMNKIKQEAMSGNQKLKRKNVLLYSLIKNLRITIVSPYYTLLFFLIIGIIVWLYSGGYFNSETIDVSLPVSFDNSRITSGK